MSIQLFDEVVNIWKSGGARTRKSWGFRLASSQNMFTVDETTEGSGSSNFSFSRGRQYGSASGYCLMTLKSARMTRFRITALEWLSIALSSWVKSLARSGVTNWERPARARATSPGSEERSFKCYTLFSHSLKWVCIVPFWEDLWWASIRLFLGWTIGTPRDIQRTSNDILESSWLLLCWN